MTRAELETLWEDLLDHRIPPEIARRILEPHGTAGWVRDQAVDDAARWLEQKVPRVEIHGRLMRRYGCSRATANRWIQKALERGPRRVW